MKKSRYTEEQILYALKQAEAGQAVADVCRQMGISEATFHIWKKRYAASAVPRARLRGCAELEHDVAPVQSGGWLLHDYLSECDAVTRQSATRRKVPGRERQ
jgi:transposase-like protein